MAAARLREQPLYINQCTADTRPEDLLVTPVLAESGKIAYHASPLVSAMLTGGVCVLDEGNRMNEKSWASLAPLLDHRRYVESVVAGVTIPAHPDFRACVTMNEDESTYEVPDYILSRLQPTLTLGFPERDDEMAILKYHLPFAEHELLALTVEFLQQAHALKLDFSPRDGITLLRFAIKRMAQDPAHPLSRDEAWHEALICVLGDEAADLDDLARRKRRALGGQHAPMGLGDIFFDPGDPLHPDADDEETMTRTTRGRRPMSATPPRPSADDFLRIGPRVRVLPIIHGSGDFAIRVREELLARPYDCVAVPLPPSFQDDVEAAIERLPAISVVTQRDVESGDDDEPSPASATCRSTPARGSSPRSGWPWASGWRGRSSTWRLPGSRRTRRASPTPTR